MHYIKYGNIFSQSFLVWEIFSHHKTALIITSLERVKHWLRLCEYFHIPLHHITHFGDIVEMTWIQRWYGIIAYDAFFSSLPSFSSPKHIFTLTPKQNIWLSQSIEHLWNLWYTYSDFLEAWNYTKHWDILRVLPFSQTTEIRVSFWGDVVEDVYFWEEKRESVSFGSHELINLFDLQKHINTDFLTYLKDTPFILDQLDLQKWYENFLTHPALYSFDTLKNYDVEQTNLEVQELHITTLKELIDLLSDTKKTCEIYTKNIKSINNFLEYNQLHHIKVFESKLNFIKSFHSHQKYVICDDILSKIFIKKRLKKSLNKDIDLLLQIKTGDYIVHIDHWVGVFKGIIKRQVGKLNKEYLEIEYKNNDKLFVPITEVGRVSKYIGSENPTLTGLSTKEWSKKLEKASHDAAKVAQELLEIYAKRQLLEWYSFVWDETQMHRFQNSFEYIYTQDQFQAIDEIREDMEKNIPMERLLVGDVWFWKTEVAFNAIYNAYLNKKQSILLSPLVVLTYEHYQKAQERFANFPLKIELLTRFQTLSQVENIKKRLISGEIDLIIGTHRVLSEHIKYKNLGLLVIDEEHKFGVEQKEQIKSLKSNIDILSLSATPIPRSLNLALSGMRGVSILSNPPAMRKWVETFVSAFSDGVIQQAINAEIQRGWQVFFIHNRVETIWVMEKYLTNIFPSLRIAVVHGQLPWNTLEERILDFKYKKYDILLASTVIENGIDFPWVNTILINDAYKFGISQIHQLRGRVGRRDIKGYCYLLFQKERLSPESAQRLTTLVEYSHLWAGFELALRDLEVRGWGDILWIKQSGISSEIGINVYLQMLEEKIEELKNAISQGEDITPSHIDTPPTVIELNISAYIHDEYFENELDKLNFYKELEYLDTPEDIEILQKEFLDETRPIPEHENLFLILKMRLKLASYFVTNIKRVWVSYEIHFAPTISQEDLKNFLDRDREVRFVVSSLTLLKTPCSGFLWDEDFLRYLDTILSSPRKSPIKLIKKKSIL